MNDTPPRKPIPGLGFASGPDSAESVTASEAPNVDTRTLPLPNGNRTLSPVNGADATAYQWRPGQSGNPSGNVSAAKRLRERLEAMADDIADGFADRIAARSDAILMESAAHLIGRPKQSTTVSVAPTDAFREALLEALAATEALSAAPLQLPPGDAPRA